MPHPTSTGTHLSFPLLVASYCKRGVSMDQIRLCSSRAGHSPFTDWVCSMNLHLDLRNGFKKLRSLTGPYCLAPNVWHPGKYLNSQTLPFQSHLQFCWWPWNSRCSSKISLWVLTLRLQHIDMQLFVFRALSVRILLRFLKLSSFSSASGSARASLISS